MPARIVPVTAASGRWLDPRFPTVVLGAEAAGRLGIQDPAGGPQLVIGRRWFTVTGVLDPIPLAPGIDRAALVGWSAARRELAFDGRPTVVYVRSHESAVEAGLAGVALLVGGIGVANTMVISALERRRENGLHQHWPPVIPPAAFGTGTGGALVVGVIAGVYPSMRAARLTPTAPAST